MIVRSVVFGFAFCLLLSLLGAEDLDWQSENPIRPPDYEGYFPDDEEGGKRLDVVQDKRSAKGLEPEEYIDLVRNGLLRTKHYRTTVLGGLGGWLIWNATPQEPLAIELMYHAAGSPDREERDRAVYSGLSVTTPKTPAILKALVDIAMTTDDHNVTGRIAWGCSEQSGCADQKDELIQHLGDYLQSDDPEIKSHAEAMVKIFSGELSAREFQESQIAKIEPESVEQVTALRMQLESGSSEERLGVLSKFQDNRVRIVIKDDEAWLAAYAAAATDPNDKVREMVVQHVGSRWIWKAEAPHDVAIDLVLSLAGDNNREVRHNVFYHGIRRLPKDHPAQAKAAEAQLRSIKRGEEEFLAAAIKAIAKKDYEDVEKFLHSVKPSPDRTYNPGEREMAERLYEEVSKRLKAARP